MASNGKPQKFQSSPSRFIPPLFIRACSLSPNSIRYSFSTQSWVRIRQGIARCSRRFLIHSRWFWSNYPQRLSTSRFLFRWKWFVRILCSKQREEDFKMRKEEAFGSITRKKLPAGMFLAAILSLLLILLPGHRSFVLPTHAQSQVKIKRRSCLKRPSNSDAFYWKSGQITDDRVKFYMKTFGGSLYITDTGEIIYSLSSSESKPDLTDKHLKFDSVGREARKITMLKESLLGFRVYLLKPLTKPKQKSITL